jgi:DNA replication protein DnaC
MPTFADKSITPESLYKPLKLNLMNEPILQKMKQMKLYGMAGAFRSMLEDHSKSGLTTDELIAFLIDSEWDDRNNRRIARRVKMARFRYKATVEQIDFTTDRNLDRNLMNRFADCTYIDKHENILITGSTGIGKSYIASALGNQACMLGYRVYYASSAKLFALLKMAKADGSYLREVARIEKTDLLILDDFGMQTLDSANRSALIEIIEDRHGRHSTIITAQLPVAMWIDAIGDKTIADAVLDRIVHNAYRIEMAGESLRKRLSSLN